jgi:hypothetical protein
MSPTTSHATERLLGLAGTAGLLLGAGPLAALPLGLSLRGAEARWRAANGFSGSFAERWAHAVVGYERTHRHPMHRALHAASVPARVVGGLGLSVSSPFAPLSWPLWIPSAAAFAIGSASSAAGRAWFAGSEAAPEDPLVLLAAPLCELERLRRTVAGAPVPA